jgi:hypothetical protein
MMNELEADVSTQDQQVLEHLDNKLKLVRDRIRGVAGGYSPGLYLYGAADLGNSVRVTRQLEEEPDTPSSHSSGGVPAVHCPYLLGAKGKSQVHAYYPN